MASASANLKLIHQRIEKVLKSEEVLSNEQMAELHTLGTLALNMDDVKYRRVHTSGAMSSAQEKSAKKNLKKTKKK